MPDPLSISVDVVQYDGNGAIIPNPIFHRSFNKLHSRTIEYPFAASLLTRDADILDIGSAKADKYWLGLLKGFPARTLFFDHDAPDEPPRPFARGDCRKMPFADQCFDMIFAISLIEHIGLLSPQTVQGHLPSYSLDGDIETLRECRRVLKPSGRLILTIPMGARGGYSPDASARVYMARDINRFAAIMRPQVLDYYEYQLVDANGSILGDNQVFGKARWKRMALDEATAENRTNMDGILCSVWTRKD